MGEIAIFMCVCVCFVLACGRAGRSAGVRAYGRVGVRAYGRACVHLMIHLITDIGLFMSQQLSVSVKGNNCLIKKEN